MNAIAFQTKLNTDVIQLPNVAGFIGKEVIVTIVEIEQETLPKKKTWRYLGAADLKGLLNNQNIRDLAYE